MNNKCLCFTLNENIYGFFLNKVVEIVQDVKVVSLPQTSKIIYGAFNLRSEFIPIINLAHLLGQETKIEREVIIIVQTNKYHLGVLVQNIQGLVNIDEYQEILNMKYYYGVGIGQEKEIYIFNPNDFISEKGLELLEKRKNEKKANNQDSIK